ncbi:MAG: CDP-alcohol phosphatidyltransferase family protein [Chthoniobacterales bacterium]
MCGELERTYKARQLEGFLDVLFYRRIGFVVARCAAKLKVAPAAITILSGACGIVAGHLYFYRSFAVNIGGMFLHIAANTFDNADGQLARLTNRTSRSGRVLDGVADHLVFLSVYLHLAFRHVFAGGSPAVFVLALAAGLSHSCQSAIADYCRNGYLYFANRRPDADLHPVERVRAEYEDLSWRANLWHKLLLRLYINYSAQQQLLAPSLIELREITRERYGTETPLWLSEHYASAMNPITKCFSILTTNTRMLLLFAVLLLGRPTWYFIIEISALNAVLAFTLVRQDRICSELIAALRARRPEPAPA